MFPDHQLRLGCFTPIKGRELFLRSCLLQVNGQTLRPDWHAVYVNGSPTFNRAIVEDLLDDRILIEHVPDEMSSLLSYTGALRMLYARGVDLFFSIDSDDVYRRDYIKSIYDYLCESRLDLIQDLFCLNLVDQHWINLYENGDTSIEPRSFRNGFGVTDAERVQGIVVGAPPTFVFNRKTAEILLAAGENDPERHYAYNDGAWRRALAKEGVRITQVATPLPIFAYVRHRNNVCWGGKGPEPPVPVRPKTIDVSIVVPTYNEGTWLERTVRSILEAKTHLSLEVVVVDDGCTDNSISLVPVDDSRVRLIQTGTDRCGLVAAKNAGAAAAQGEYLCFVDSHMLFHDGWLDRLKATCLPDSLVSGEVVSLSDQAALKARHPRFAYTLKDWSLRPTWFFHGFGGSGTYAAPLCPGGLMFLSKARFNALGGFARELRKWGREDIELSLRNYYLGGSTLVDPGVLVWHHYKDVGERSFDVDDRDLAFNSLFVAQAYLPNDACERVRRTLELRSPIGEVIRDLNSPEVQQSIAHRRTGATRGYQEWSLEFCRELQPLLQPRESLTFQIFA